MQITCNKSGAHYMEHVVCNVVRRDSSAIKFDRVYIAFSLALFHWLEASQTSLDCVSLLLIVNRLFAAPWGQLN